MARIPQGFGDYGTVADHYDQGRQIHHMWPQYLMNRFRGFDTWSHKNRGKFLVLDVGCGTGVYTRSLRGNGFRVVGADIDPLMIERARRLPHRDPFDDDCQIQYIVSPVELLDFPDGSFDIITTCGGLAWFYDAPGALENIQRMLRPNGIFQACDESPVGLPDLAAIRRKYLRKKAPSRINTYPGPEEVLKEAGFMWVRSINDEWAEDLCLSQAVSYILSGSWTNFVPKARMGELEDDVRSVCRNNTRWTFRYSSTIGRKRRITPS